MKKMILLMLVLLTAVCVLTGCNSEKAVATSDKKEILFQINNTSGQDWVLLTGTYGSDEYRGDQYSKEDNDNWIDQIDVKDFTIKAGQSYPYKVSGVLIEQTIQSGRLKETSETTYEYMEQFVAAGLVPEDTKEKYIYTPFCNVQDMSISGTYGESVVIEWDGNTFKQAK